MCSDLSGCSEVLQLLSYGRLGLGSLRLALFLFHSTRGFSSTTGLARPSPSGKENPAMAWLLEPRVPDSSLQPPVGQLPAMGLTFEEQRCQLFVPVLAIVLSLPQLSAPRSDYATFVWFCFFGN